MMSSTTPYRALAFFFLLKSRRLVNLANGFLSRLSTLVGVRLCGVVLKVRGCPAFTGGRHDPQPERSSKYSKTGL